MTGFGLIPDSAQRALYGSSSTSSTISSSHPIAASPLALGTFSASAIHASLSRNDDPAFSKRTQVIAAFQAKEQQPLGDILRSAGRKALGGGIPGAAGRKIEINTLSHILD